MNKVSPVDGAWRPSGHGPGARLSACGQRSRQAHPPRIKPYPRGRRAKRDRQRIQPGEQKSPKGMRPHRFGLYAPSHSTPLRTLQCAKGGRPQGAGRQGGAHPGCTRRGEGGHPFGASRVCTLGMPRRGSRAKSDFSSHTCPGVLRDRAASRFAPGRGHPSGDPGGHLRRAPHLTAPQEVEQIVGPCDCTRCRIGGNLSEKPALRRRKEGGFLNSR